MYTHMKPWGDIPSEILAEMLDGFQPKGHQLVVFWDEHFAENVLSVHGHPQFALHPFADCAKTYTIFSYSL